MLTVAEGSPVPDAPQAVQEGSAQMGDEETMKQRIRREARRLGFRLCGFAGVQPLPHGDFVRQWLVDGNAAGMAYIERGLAKRLDPRLILPRARSVITVGDRYLPPPLPVIDWRQQMRGRIAAYALGPAVGVCSAGWRHAATSDGLLGADYHRTVAGRLDALARFVSGLKDSVTVRAYVDTGAVLEREWAAGGGVGWFGKNTNILHTEEGSYFFLAELLTTLELTPDAPLVDHCGTCTRCLDLCPTGALAAGYVLDARRCIAYWTIEHRGAIPTQMRPKLGNWIFGCDVCQEVCPWNEKLTQREDVPASAVLLPYLPDLLFLDEGGFRVRFGGSAIRRAKREGLVRNVAIALGNSGNPAAVPPLAQALRHDASAVVRGHAAWALAAIGGRPARRALDEARRSESDTAVRAEIDTGLERS
jgi:epoxyqueuosine reductase